MGQEGFVRAKRKLGTTLGKAGKSFFFFSFETVYLFGSFFIFYLALFHLVFFEHGAQGKKTTDITASNRETARVQGGMDREPVIRAFFLSFFFLWTGNRVLGTLGFGWNGL